MCLVAVDCQVARKGGLSGCCHGGLRHIFCKYIMSGHREILSSLQPLLLSEVSAAAMDQLRSVQTTCRVAASLHVCVCVNTRAVD